MVGCGLPGCRGASSGGRGGGGTVGLGVSGRGGGGSGGPIPYGGEGGVRPTAGVPIPEGNWYPAVVEVVDLVPGSIPERVQYANMEVWRMDCPWWLALTVIPVKRSASLLSMYHESSDCTMT